MYINDKSEWRYSNNTFNPKLSTSVNRQKFLLSFSKSSSKKSLESLNGKLNFASQRNACYFPIVNKFCLFSLRIVRFALMICFVSHQGVDCECPLVVYLFYSYPFWFNVAPYSLHLLDRFRTFDLLFVFNFNFSPFLLYSTVFWNIYGYKIMYLELNKDIFDWESIFQTPVTPFPLSSNFFHWKNNLFKRFLNFAYILSSYCWFPLLSKL